jgi:virginiamycin B lyase
VPDLNITQELTPQWWQELAHIQAADPQRFPAHYCSARVFKFTKLCLAYDAAMGLHTVESEADRLADGAQRLGVKLDKDQTRTALSQQVDLPNAGARFGSQKSSSYMGTSTENSSATGNPSSGAHIVEYQIPTSGSVPIDVKLGPDGALWFSMIFNEGTSGIGRLDPVTKQIAMFHLPNENGITYPINGGPGPYVWWTSIPGVSQGNKGYGNKVGRIHVVTHEIDLWDIPTPFSYPADMKIGPDGGLWITETLGNKMARFDPETFKIEEFPLAKPLSLPQDLAVVEDKGETPDLDCTGPGPAWQGSPRWKDLYDAGACNATGIYWSNQGPGTNSLGRIDAYTHKIDDYPYPTPSLLVLDISVGKDGRTVWYVPLADARVGFFDPVNKKFTELETDTIPACCTFPGADEANYWGQMHSNTVGRYDLKTKAITYIPIPTQRAFPLDFQTANGSVYFSLARANKIAEIVPDTRMALTAWPCGCGAPEGSPWNPKPIKHLLEASRPGGLPVPTSW